VGNLDGKTCSDAEWNSNQPPLELHVLVTAQGGWHSKGSSPQYSPSYPVTNSATGVRTGNIHDRYMRGIKFVFSTGQFGNAEVFDAMLFILKLTSVLVLLSLAPAITLIIAQNFMGEKSIFYKQITSEPVKVERAEHKLALEAVVASQSFSSLASTLGKADKLHVDEVVKGFVEGSGVPLKEAQNIASHVFKGKEELTFLEFANLFGLEGVSLERLMAEPASEGAVNIPADQVANWGESTRQVKVAPAPEPGAVAAPAPEPRR